MTRDPRRSPQPGDWMAVGETLVRVDHVALGEVYFAAFGLDATQPHSVSAVPLLEWYEATRDGAIYAMAADDPRQHAMIIEAQP